MLDKETLPIGSVVRLSGATALAMIAGYLPTGSAREGYVWDYCGFRYPIGYEEADIVYQFDASQIEEVIALGYQDTEAFAFSEHLINVRKNLPEIRAAALEREKAATGKTENEFASETPEIKE